MNKLALILLSVALQATMCTSVWAAKPRARDLGVPFDGVPGKLNAITDVGDVAVGYSTLNTMIGMNGKKAVAIDHKTLQRLLKEHGRLVE